MRARGIAVALCIGALSLACGLLGDGSAALEKMDQLADEACACPTLECLKEVQTRQAKYFQEHGDDLVAAGQQGRDAVEKSARRIADCATKLAKGEGPAAGGSSGGGKKGTKKKRKKNRGKKKR